MDSLHIKKKIIKDIFFKLCWGLRILGEKQLSKTKINRIQCAVIASADRNWKSKGILQRLRKASLKR